MGGTFDPIHLGHLVVAEAAREAHRLDQVVFVPAGRPPHKKETEVSEARHRYVMTLLATMSHPQFTVSRIELDRQGKSFTVDTLSQLIEEAGEGTELSFILGADSMADVPNWREPERLLGLCRFLVVSRPGFGMDDVKTSLGPLYEEHKSRLELLDVPAIGVSSSEIRRRVAQGKSIRYLVPDGVLRYIHDHGMYRNEE